MPKVSKRRSFSRDFKSKVITRMEAGENVRALSRQFSIKYAVDRYRLIGIGVL